MNTRLILSLLIALPALLGRAGDAVAATNWVPRMERVAACSWDRPGHNPFMGDVVAAVDRYREIPTPVRMRLKQRMQARQYDDLVDIRRDSIGGRHRYEPGIRDMHFGLDRVCRQVTRANWTARMHERGLVYCEAGHCILVPTVCRNVSRIERRPADVAAAQIGATPARASAAAGDGAAGEPRAETPAMAVAAAPALHLDSGAPAAPSFSDGASGTPSPWWPTAGDGVGAGRSGGAPSSHGDRSGAQAQPAQQVAWPIETLGGGSLPREFSPGGRGSSTPAGGGGLPGGGLGHGDGPLVLGPGDGGTVVWPVPTDPPGGGGPIPTDPLSGVWPIPNDLPAGGGPIPFGPIGGSGPLPTGPLGGGPAPVDPIGGAGSGFDPAPVTPVPEPSTWASLLTGLVLMAVTVRRRQGRSGAPRCATQKRS